MKLEKVHSVTHPLYGASERLLCEAFPEDERRDLRQQRENVVSNRRFSLFAACEGDEFVGFVTVWEFDEFRYVEHLATEVGCRCKGVGAAILGEVKEKSRKPVVLEVEMPDSGLAQRRIGFYRRNGFRVLDVDYVQPPYRQGGNSLPMLLMSTCALEPEEVGRVIRTLQRDVYGV